jgi:hypothetical protein
VTDVGAPAKDAGRAGTEGATPTLDEVAGVEAGAGAVDKDEEEAAGSAVEAAEPLRSHGFGGETIGVR